MSDDRLSEDSDISRGEFGKNGDMRRYLVERWQLDHSYGLRSDLLVRPPPKSRPEKSPATSDSDDPKPSRFECSESSIRPTNQVSFLKNFLLETFDFYDWSSPIFEYFFGV